MPRVPDRPATVVDLLTLHLVTQRVEEGSHDRVARLVPELLETAGPFVRGVGAGEVDQESPAPRGTGGDRRRGSTAARGSPSWAPTAPLTARDTHPTGEERDEQDARRPEDSGPDIHHQLRNEPGTGGVLGPHDRFTLGPSCNKIGCGGDSRGETVEIAPRGGALTTDETIRRAADGDARAFEAIYRHHHRRVWTLASRWEADPDRAEDLLQETFVRVWRALPEFRGDSALSTWIHTIALRTALDRARRDSRRDERSRVAASTVDLEIVPAPGASVDLERAIAALPDGQRRMFLLHALEGYRCREIAETMGVAVGTVQSQVFRAREKLKEALDR